MQTSHPNPSGSLPPAHSASPRSSASPGSSKVVPTDTVAGVVLGRASEYFEFFVYAFASVLAFPAVFFPMYEPLAAMLLAFAIFALAFIVRPLGTVLFLWVEQHWGRVTKLILALALMSLCTAGIAFLPGYGSLGVVMIGLLALFRLGQGVAQGGSWDGLPSLLALNAPHPRRGWYAMVGQLGAPIGFILAAALFAYLVSSLSPEEFLAWGWRYPLLAAVAINIMVLFARLQIVISHQHEMVARDMKPVSVLSLASEKGFYVVAGAAVALAGYALFHVLTIFALSWTVLGGDQAIASFLWLQVLGGFLAMGGMVLSGVLADRFGRTRLLVVIAIAIACFGCLVPGLLADGGPGRNIIVLLGFVLLGLSFGQAAGVVAAQLGVRYRYTGSALSSDLAWLVGAAFAPLLVLGLATQFGLMVVGLYLVSGALCMLAALALSRYFQVESL